MSYFNDIKWYQESADQLIAFSYVAKSFLPDMRVTGFHKETGRIVYAWEYYEGYVKYDDIIFHSSYRPIKMIDPNNLPSGIKLVYISA